MTRIRVPLGKFIKEYSERNKGNEDIPVYSVTNSQGFCTEYFGKEVASQDKTTYKIVPQGYFAYNPSRINVGSVDWQRYEKRVIVSPLYNVFSVSEGIDRQYLYYFLRSDLGRQMIKAKASGSVRDIKVIFASWWFVMSHMQDKILRILKKRMTIRLLR